MNRRSFFTKTFVGVAAAVAVKVGIKTKPKSPTTLPNTWTVRAHPFTYNDMIFAKGDQRQSFIVNKEDTYTA